MKLKVQFSNAVPACPPSAVSLVLDVVSEHIDDDQAVLEAKLQQMLRRIIIGASPKGDPKPPVAARSGDAAADGNRFAACQCARCREARRGQ